ncbi:hypothetical protein EGW08_017524 [Elysia chlorotica]|uniref:Thioredoxin domain-containing protein n=1 Tax=Elysia chlorotica TaxID=188477 RepID=A0A3S1B8L4_ELYCH|nr:hypothetical protein EGW08_017524 [Elysia chlorotica]
MQLLSFACLGGLLLLLGSASSERILDELRSVTFVNADTLQTLTNSESLSLVFFLRGVTTDNSFFLKEYDTSAERLKAYDITLALFDCTNAKDREASCTKDDIDTSVFSYRKGMSLISVKVEHLFDVDSIMAHALQLLMLHEVPIIESMPERIELEQSQVGNKDVIFIYTDVIGTREHRIFMEVAYAYQDKFSFALTTDRTLILGLQAIEETSSGYESGLWVLFCSQMRKDEFLKNGHCEHTMYRGKPTLFSLAKFVGNLQEKSVFYAPEDGVASVFEMSSDDPIVYVYAKPDQKEKTTEIMNAIANDLRGSAKLVIVDMENSDCQSAANQQGYTGAGSGIGLKTNNGTMHFLDPKDWNESGVKDFLQPHIFPDWKSEELHPSSLATSQNNIKSLIDAVETQDDQVASAVYSVQKKEMAGLELVPELFTDNFHRTIRRSPLLLILFYGPLHHLSLAFLRDFGVAAQTLANNYSAPNALARVNCFDANDLCSAENVTTYPTVRIYRQNPASYETYKESLDALAVARTTKLLQLNGPLLLTREEEVEKFSQGQHPTDFSKFSSSSVVLLTTDSTSGDSAMFQALSGPMCQVTALAVVHPSIVPQIAQKYETKVPSLLAFNREDTVKPLRSMSLNDGDKTAADLTAFIRAATIPFVPELGPENFPHLYARHQPMAVLFLDGSDVETKDAVLASFSSISTSDQFPATVFCWMDAQVKTLGLEILSEYTETVELPMVSVVKHRQGQVFNFQPKSQHCASTDPIQVDALAAWLQQVLSGRASPSKILEQGEWGPPGPYYNFLEFQQNAVERLSQTSFTDGAEDDESERFEDGSEVEEEVRRMLLELHRSARSVQEPHKLDIPGEQRTVQDIPGEQRTVQDIPGEQRTVQDIPGEQRTVQDTPADHGHIEL